MDLLGDILKQANLRRRILNQRAFGAKVALRFPCAKSIGFHVAVQGEGFIHLKGRATPILLKKGDVALMARGVDHIVSTDKILPNKIALMGELDPMVLADSVAAKKTKLNLVSGAFQLWNDPIHPFFDDLPDIYVLAGDQIPSHDALHATIGLLSAEVSQLQLGSETIVQGLLDIIFSHIIRKIVMSNNAKPETWSFALHNAQVRSALELMHADCARNWTVEELAKSVGLSRAGFAQKFKSTLGDTPLHYLTTVRVQKAMELLTSSNDKIEIVAQAVGYKDAFSFSKIFKKLAGVPPKDFRHKDREEKALKWRF
jgi:AraC-like DNA-binding protein